MMYHRLVLLLLLLLRLKALLESDESFHNVTALAKILNAHRKRVYAAVGTLEHCNMLTKGRLNGKQAFVYHGKSNIIDEVGSAEDNNIPYLRHSPGLGYRCESSSSSVPFRKALSRSCRGWKPPQRAS